MRGLGVILGVLITGTAAASAALAQERGPIAAAGEALAGRYGKDHAPVEAGAAPAVPPYALPVDPKKIANREALEALGLVEGDARKALLDQGFVVLLRPPFRDDPIAFYEWVERMGVPVYATADSVLHLYHIQFDELLKGLEERELAGELEGMLGALREELLKADAVAREKQVVAVYRQGLDRALAFVAAAERLLTDRSRERDRVGEARAKLAEMAKTEKFRDWMRFYTDYADVRTILSALNATLPDGERFAPHDLESPPESVSALLNLCDRYEALAAKRGGASQKLPPEIETLVAAEVASIRGRQGPKPSAIFTYDEDFTQYVPRGHYTRSDLLKRYFVAMMYLGRMTFLVKGGEGPKYLVSKDEAHAQTVAASLIARALKDAGVEDRWARIYSLTGFFVGLADDLTALDYAPAIARAGGDVVDPARFARFQLEVARMQPPAIYSGMGDLEYLDPKALEGEPSPDVVDRALAATQGFRLMGQRFTPDGYIHGRLVQPTVGKLHQAALDKRDSALPFTAEMIQGQVRRAFPRGLDVAAWLLGSKRAARLLADLDDSSYEGYADVVARIEKDVAALTPASWNGNLYYAWLHALRGLVGVEYGKGFPTYMQGDAWATKELATALGSWSQLRHDTILYVKQPYGMRAGSAPPPAKREVTGHVEPVPELYARLLALARFTRAVLVKEKALDDKAKERLDETEALLAKLLELARHELAGKPLSKEDAAWVKSFASRLKRATQGTETEALKTTLVADVFTDGNTRQCLEVATGALAVLVVLTGHPDGTVEIAAGPAFTTYEFKHPAADRLTDEAWRAMLEKGERDGRRDLLPDWTRGLYR